MKSSQPSLGSSKGLLPQDVSTWARITCVLRVGATMPTTLYPLQVNEDAQKLLLHATLHGITWGSDRHCAGLPAIGRILLQAPGAKTSKYQEAVVRALAVQVGASLLVVDSIMLQTLARSALGRVPDALPPPESTQVGSNSGVLGLLLSLWLAGGRAALVWELIADALTGVRGPVILFVRDVEDAVCSSYEQYDAFVHVFGTRTRHPLRRGMVLIAGCSLADAGTAITDNSKARYVYPTDRCMTTSHPINTHSRMSEGGMAAGTRTPSPPFDNTTATPSLVDLQLPLGEASPNTRRALSRLFSTRIKLSPPPGGPMAAAHQQQLVEDASSSVREANYRRLLLIANERRCGS